MITATSPATQRFQRAVSQHGAAFVFSTWLAWVACAAGLILAPSWVPRAPGRPHPVQTVFSPDTATRVDAWLAPLAAGRDGLRLAHAEVIGSTIVVRIDGPTNRDADELVLSTYAEGEPIATLEASRSFGIQWWVRSGAVAARSLLADAARLVAEADDGRIVVSVTPLPLLFLPEAYRWLGVGLLVAALLLAWRDRLRLPTPRDAVVKRTHLLPIAIQLAIGVYWAVHYPPVRPMAMLVLAQFMFAFLLDSLLAWALRRPWPGPFAMVAPVLSANLFVWFGDRNVWESFLVVALAVGSKALIRRSGRHVFNPSGFGLAVVGLLAILRPQIFPYNAIAGALAAGPNMLEVMFLVTLMPLVLLGTVHIAVGAALAMELLHTFSPSSPNWAWPGFFLAMTIFAGDPATAPRSPGGRLLYGLFIGAGIHGAAVMLTTLVGTDFWSKVMPIPVANLLAPQFERVGTWLDGVVSSIVARLPRLAPGFFYSPTLAGTAIWTLLFLSELPQGKVGFHAPSHSEWSYPLLCAGPDGRVNCETNRVFCEPFSFDLELRAWARLRNKLSPCLTESPSLRIGR